MIKPRMSRSAREVDNAPPCPHCHEPMDDATLTLGEFMEHWPPPARVEVGIDGYAHGYYRFAMTCPTCRRQSALAMDAMHVKLIALRTEADDRYLGCQVFG